MHDAPSARPPASFFAEKPKANLRLAFAMLGFCFVPGFRFQGALQADFSRHPAEDFVLFGRRGRPAL